MGELAEEQRILEKLPAWVPEYLAAWGSVRPDGKAMSVEWAAGLAGVSAVAVRMLRGRHREFRTLEYLARHGTAAFMVSYAEAGLRGAAPAIVAAFRKLIDDGEYHTVIQGMKWLMDKPDLAMEGSLGIEYVNDWRENPLALSTPGTDSGEEAGPEVQLASGGPEMAQDDTGDGNRS